MWRHWCEAVSERLFLLMMIRSALTNLNRQIIATRKTVGKYKTEVMKERILEINPEARVGASPVLLPSGECR